MKQQRQQEPKNILEGTKDSRELYAAYLAQQRLKKEAKIPPDPYFAQCMGRIELLQRNVDEFKQPYEKERNSFGVSQKNMRDLKQILDASAQDFTAIKDSILVFEREVLCVHESLMNENKILTDTKKVLVKRISKLSKKLDHLEGKIGFLEEKVENEKVLERDRRLADLVGRDNRPDHMKTTGV